jgi:hypothetical protein
VLESDWLSKQIHIYRNKHAVLWGLFAAGCFVEKFHRFSRGHKISTFCFLPGLICAPNGESYPSFLRSSKCRVVAAKRTIDRAGIRLDKRPLWVTSICKQGAIECSSFVVYGLHDL